MPLRKLKYLWVNGLRKVRDHVEDAHEELEQTSPISKVILLLTFAYGLVAIVMGIYWSITPRLFDVERNAQQLAHTSLNNDKPVVDIPGVTTTATLIRITETLWTKNGGYIYNDITPPSLWLDDISHWEYGVIIQVRDMSKALREAFSRSQSQSREDADLQKAESRFNFNHDSWIFPATESQYREGSDFLQSYLTRLADNNSQDAQFFARADNLNYWLATVETRLGSLSQRLSASVGQERLQNAQANYSNTTELTNIMLYTKTPWNELDDVFYEARGSAWALIHLLKAIEVDFSSVLNDKNALISVQQIIRELEATQQPLFSPVVLNGSGFGLVANHSLVMASYISRANAAIIDLRRLLEQG